MTSTMNHSHCPHPATKAARAKCRKARASRDAQVAAEVASLITAYDKGADLDEVIHDLALLVPAVADAYYGDTDLEVEEIIALAR